MNSSEGMRRLGENLRSRRIILGLSQELVAERADVSRPTLMRLETGEGGKIEHLMKIASVLGIAEDLISAVDPLNTDLGRARAHLLGRQRAPRRK
ncbi:MULTISPECIES: helix-turn-helix transcriptional regulator [Paenarthrobacter]|uniref:helix-turn-helix transcriptional regulator n=1 Tax=Paenarthrobacter TaxID=1742992 RepID=UPI0014150BA8|nr:helix-turn-helix transcriptional regulator [Paenarthrobacter nitroguajacolicus]